MALGESGRVPASRSIRDDLAKRDAQRFVGREHELADLEDLLAPHPASPFVYLYGPPGIGKSALAREFARRAVERGFVVESFDPATLGDPASRADLVRRVEANRVAVVLIDPWTVGDGEAQLLREQVLLALPAGTRALIVSRLAPARGWSEHGWEALLRSIELGPLDDADARTLARQLAVKPEHVDELLRWAEGEPLALVLGATHRRRHPEGPALDGDPRLAGAVLERVLEDEAATVDEEVLRVAALLPSVDEPLLADVVPRADARDAVGQLGALTVTRRFGGRLSLHARTRRALTDRFAHDDPAGDRDLRRRLADHLYERINAGEPGWLPSFAHLFRDPALRWAFGSDARQRHRIDRPRTGDEGAAAAALGASGTVWWAGIQRWFEEAPGAVTVVRDQNDRLSAFCVLVTPVSAPSWADEDRVMGPRLEHARQRYPAGDVVLWRDAFGFPADPDEDPAGPTMVAVHGAINRSGRVDALGTYGTVVTGDPVALKLATTYGAVPVEELRVADGERTVECHVLHHGFGGFAGGARALVYLDIGLTPPPPSAQSIRVAVRGALRNFHDPVVLATNPLASGASTSERSESVRAMLVWAIESGFGGAPEPRLVAEVLERGYLRRGGTHEEAANALHLGRSTYFRHLATGIDRIAVLIAERLEASSAGL